jgi:hypothetical protein
MSDAVLDKLVENIIGIMEKEVASNISGATNVKSDYWNGRLLCSAELQKKIKRAIARELGDLE